MGLQPPVKEDSTRNWAQKECVELIYPESMGLMWVRGRQRAA